MTVSWQGDMTRKRRQLNTSLEDVKTGEKYKPHFGGNFEKGSHTSHTGVEMKLANKYNRTISENQKENSCLCLLSRSHFLSLSLLMTCCFSLSSKCSRLSFHTLLFFLLDVYLKSAVVNKLLC